MQRGLYRLLSIDLTKHLKILFYNLKYRSRDLVQLELVPISEPSNLLGLFESQQLICDDQFGN